MRFLFPVALLLGGFFMGCEAPKDKKGRVLDTPTTGTLRLMIDEGYRPILQTSMDVYDSIYSLAKFDPTYTSEGEAVAALLKDSVQVIVITRKLTDTELQYFTKRGFTPKVTPIAHDAVAFVVNPQNRDTLFTVAQLHDIMTGQIKSWKQLNPKSPLADIRLAFGMEVSEATIDSRIIVIDLELDGEATLIGIRTDRVYEVTTLMRSASEPPPSVGMRWPAAYVDCLVKRGSEFVIV
ncbi:MAG TPA: substrate-binding domain-containing protein, partial [Saprospiraceae bacterium]|nr:substrate-binding domain-containing protein [Saprospiraceae bacterium]